MKVIQGSETHIGTEFFNFTLDSEPVLIKFNTQFDDLMISSLDGNILISWDADEWDDSQCLLIKSHDNLKEINNLKCTKLLLKAFDQPTKVWVVAQRN